MGGCLYKRRTYREDKKYWGKVKGKCKEIMVD